MVKEKQKPKLEFLPQKMTDAFKKLDTEKNFPTFKSYKLRLLNREIWFQAENLLGSSTFLFYIISDLHFTLKKVK